MVGVSAGRPGPRTPAGAGRRRRAAPVRGRDARRVPAYRARFRAPHRVPRRGRTRRPPPGDPAQHGPAARWPDRRAGARTRLPRPGDQPPRPGAGDPRLGRSVTPGKTRSAAPGRGGRDRDQGAGAGSRRRGPGARGGPRAAGVPQRGQRPHRQFAGPGAHHPRGDQRGGAPLLRLRRDASAGPGPGGRGLPGRRAGRDDRLAPGVGAARRRAGPLGRHRAGRRDHAVPRAHPLLPVHGHRGAGADRARHRGTGGSGSRGGSRSGTCAR